MDSYGQIRLKNLQDSANSSYGSGKTPFSGSSAGSGLLTPGKPVGTGEITLGAHEPF